MMPNFIIAGAPKSGTTSLYHYCAEHPEIFMSSVKEPNFFSTNPHRYTRETYEDLFAKWEGELAIGEASPSYLLHEAAPGAIREAIPHCRIVIILRNPVERLLSDYHYSQSWGWNLDSDLSTFVDKCRRTNGKLRPGFTPEMMVAKGRYAAQVKRYQRVFAGDRLFVRLYEDLKRDPSRLMADLYTFLGVDPAFRPDISRIHNGYAEPIFPGIARFIARVQHVEHRLVSPLLPSSMHGILTNSLLELNRRKYRERKKSPQLSSEDRQRLVDLYRSDIEALQESISRDLGAWLR